MTPSTSFFLSSGAHITEEIFCITIDLASTKRWSEPVSNDSTEIRSAITRSTTVLLMVTSAPDCALPGLRNSAATVDSSPLSESFSNTRNRSADVKRKTISLTFLNISS
jgi:hypothetical protein